MRVPVAVAQIPIGWDIGKNLAVISEVVEQARPDEVVVFPEGALSGYAPDLSPLATLDRPLLAAAVTAVAALARRRRVHVFCGSLWYDQGTWLPGPAPGGCGR